MQHFPIFLNVSDQGIVVSGGGEAALAKLRLLLKTTARITVFAPDAAPGVVALAAEKRITLLKRPLASGDALGAMLFYAANEDAAEDTRVAAVARAEGALVNIVDNLADSAFITPAIVDRAPVTVAIGTEGAAPVLARAIKTDLEERLPVHLGLLARAGKAFRHAAEALPMGARRRDFWADYYFNAGPKAIEARGVEGLTEALSDLLDAHIVSRPRAGHVDLVDAGAGDPELLTLRARKALDAADVVIHDRRVAPEILELARREAILIAAADDNFDALLGHARKGLHVVRLAAGDPARARRFARKSAALKAAGISCRIVPGVAATPQYAPIAAIARSIGRARGNAPAAHATHPAFAPKEAAR